MTQFLNSFIKPIISWLEIDGFAVEFQYTYDLSCNWISVSNTYTVAIIGHILPVVFQFIRLVILIIHALHTSFTSLDEFTKTNNIVFSGASNHESCLVGHVATLGRITCPFKRECEPAYQERYPFTT